MKIKVLNRKNSISIIILVFLFIYTHAYTQTPFEKIKNWGDSLFAFYDTVKFGNENTHLEYVSLDDEYSKLDSLDVNNLFLYFNTNTVDTNHLIRWNRFKILKNLYAKTNSVKLAEKILEALFSPQYYQYLSEMYGKIYSNEVTSVCKKRIVDFLNEKMEDSIAQKIVYYKIKYNKRFDIENLKKLYPNQYTKSVNELADSIARINLEENANSYKNSIFDERVSISLICNIIGDKFWKDLSPFLEKRYLNALAKKDAPRNYSQIVEVLSRFNYKNYKMEYYNKAKERFSNLIYSKDKPLCDFSTFTTSVKQFVYSECFECLILTNKKMYEDSSKFYLCPDIRFVKKGEKQKKGLWSNDFINDFEQTFLIANSSNWRAFSSQNEAIFNKAGADEIKKWLSKYNQKTFLFNKYDGYYKFPKSRKSI